MVEIPDVAIGTIIASLIAGIISLLGLIISKEQKTSEFRQEWIDALRTDLSAYLTQINAIHDAAQVKHQNLADKISALQPLYMPLNTSTFNILLRVNPKEEKSKSLLDAMEKFGTILKDKKELNTANIRHQETEYLLAAQALLKFEWNRVKTGEMTFKLAKFLALFVVLVSISIGCFAAYKLWWQPSMTPIAAATITEGCVAIASQAGGPKTQLPKPAGKN